MVAGPNTAANASLSAPTVAVNVSTADGISLPAHVHAGIVTFTFSQLDADFHAVQGFSLKNGATLDQAVADFNDALLGDAPTKAAAVNALNHDTTLMGGALMVAGASISVTESVPAGTYYFLDYADVGELPVVRVATIHADGLYRLAPLPAFDKVIVATMQNGLPRFITSTSLSAQQTFFFYNSSDEAHEVMFRPTQPGITDDYITAFYDAVLAGGVRPPSPWTGVQAGLQPMSPGQWAVVHIDLPAGPYAEICYIPDDVTGIPHAYEGMHVIVNLS